MKSARKKYDSFFRKRVKWHGDGDRAILFPIYIFPSIDFQTQQEFYSCQIYNH